MSQLKYPDEIVVFPNSKRYEFKSEEKIRKFLKEELPNRNSPGQYNFHSYSRLKNIKVGSLVLFRFSDKIVGVAIVSKEAVKENMGSDLEGYITLKEIQVLHHSLLIEELEKMTEISFHQKGRSYSIGLQSYQRIPKSKIKIVVDRLNKILSDNANIPNEQENNKRRGGIPHADPELGRMAEEFILSLESKKLEGSGKTPEKVRDGEGYDIRSWDEKGKEIHIEVKTTNGNLEDRIVFTLNEYHKSISDSSYWIYRVYDFNNSNKTGKIKKIKGSFEDSFEFEPLSFSGTFDEEKRVRSKKDD